jgi:enoyl-CoA hydratase/carnithine racemase
VLTLSNPPYNLVTRAMCEELDQYLRRIESDPSIGAVVLTSDLEGIFLSRTSRSLDA